MAKALQDTRDHLPMEKEVTHNQFLDEALREAGPHALGLALGYLAVDLNKQRFYHVHQRDNFFDRHWNAWVSNIWIRPAWPTQPILDIAPRDVRASFNDNWGVF